MKLFTFLAILFTSFSIWGQSITISTPNGGEFINANTSYNITWNTSGTVGLLDLYYTVDNGVNWTFLTSGIDPNSGSYVWSVPNTPTNVCLIRLTDGTVQDESDAVFSINFSNNAITVTSPNGGEVYSGGSTQTVTWTTGGPVGSLSFFYSIDNGANWTLYASGISAFSGSYSWTVPNVTSNQCLVKLTDNIAVDQSNATFTINGVGSGAVNIIQPNGGEMINMGSQYNIQWSVAGTVNPLDIFYSIDGGSNWTLITSGATGTSFSWSVPNLISSTCKVRLTDGIIADISNANFSIVDPTQITLLSPNGGEILQGFDAYEITWDTQNNSHIDSVEISLQENGTFDPSFVTVENTGSYFWDVPNISTTNAKINVLLQGTNIQDSSDAAFTINPIDLFLVNPNGGEILVGGADYEINWIQTGIFSGVDVFLSMDNGVTFNAIATNVLDTFYVWNTPNVDTTSCLIRITYQNLVSDTSDNVFEIEFQEDSTNSIIEHNHLFTVYPNPTSGILNLEIENLSLNTVYIYSMSGVQVAYFENQKVIDLYQLASGMYLIKCKTLHNIFTKQISIIR